MEQATATPTATPEKEYIAWPDSIEFGGVKWTRATRPLEARSVEYVARHSNKTEMRVYRYPQEYEQWLWKACFLGIEPCARLVHDYEIGIIVDNMEDAMTCAVNAFDDWLDDMQRILREQRPGDRYALGFSDGLAAAKAKIERVLS